MVETEAALKPAGPLARWYAPGFAFYAVAISAGVIVLAFDGAVVIFAFLAGLLLGFIIGLIWFVLFVITAFRSRLRLGRRAWLRWLGVPAIGFLCVALMFASVPLRARFELSRTEFDRAVARVSAGENLSAGQIGLFHIDYVTPLSNGVWFEDMSAGFIDPCGLAYSVSGSPDIRFLDVDLGGGWWFACEHF